MSASSPKPSCGFFLPWLAWHVSSHRFRNTSSTSNSLPRRRLMSAFPPTASRGSVSPVSHGACQALTDSRIAITIQVCKFDLKLSPTSATHVCLPPHLHAFSSLARMARAKLSQIQESKFYLKLSPTSATHVCPPPAPSCYSFSSVSHGACQALTYSETASTILTCKFYLKLLPTSATYVCLSP